MMRTKGFGAGVSIAFVVCLTAAAITVAASGEKGKRPVSEPTQDAPRAVTATSAADATQIAGDAQSTPREAVSLSTTVAKFEPTRAAPGEVFMLADNLPVQHMRISAATGQVTSGQSVIAGTPPLGPELVYSNTPPETLIRILGANRLIADDVTTIAAEGCPVSSYEVKIARSLKACDGDGVSCDDDTDCFVGAGTCILRTDAGFQLDVAIYDDCPDTGGQIIPGTEGTFVVTDNGVFTFTVDLSGNDPLLDLPNSFWIGVQTDTEGVGWVFGTPAGLGFTQNVFSFPAFNCQAQVSGQLYAGFFARVFCVGDFVTEFFGYLNVSQSTPPPTFSPGAGFWLSDNLELIVPAFGTPACLLSSLEITSLSTGPYTITAALWNNCMDVGNLALIVPNSQITFQGSGGNAPEIARMVYDTPVQLFGPNITVGWRYTNNTSTVIAMEPELGMNDGTIGFTGQPMGQPTCGLVLGSGLFSAFAVNMLCLGEPPLGACCDVSTNQPSGGACDRLPQIACGNDFQRWEGGDACPQTCQESGDPCADDNDCFLCEQLGTPCTTVADCTVCTGVASIEGTPCATGTDCKTCASGPLVDQICAFSEDCSACTGVPAVEGQACTTATDCTTCATPGVGSQGQACVTDTDCNVCSNNFQQTCTADRDINDVCPPGEACCDVGATCELLANSCSSVATCQGAICSQTAACAAPGGCVLGNNDCQIIDPFVGVPPPADPEDCGTGACCTPPSFFNNQANGNPCRHFDKGACENIRDEDNFFCDVTGEPCSVPADCPGVGTCSLSGDACTADFPSVGALCPPGETCCSPVGFCPNDMSVCTANLQGLDCPLGETCCVPGVPCFLSETCTLEPQACVGKAAVWHRGSFCNETGEFSFDCIPWVCRTSLLSCDQAHPNDNPGCFNPNCCAKICSFDGFCCDVSWDGTCVGQVNGPNGCAFPVGNDDCSDPLSTAKGAFLLNTCSVSTSVDCETSADCPAGETCTANRQASFDNGDATGEPIDALCCNPIGEGISAFGSIWFKFIASATSARIDTCNTGADRDSFLQVYNPQVFDELGNVVNNPTDELACPTLGPIACSDNEPFCGSGNNLSDICAQGLTIGRTYYVQLSSKTPSDQGLYFLRLTSPCPGGGVTQPGNNTCAQALDVTEGSTAFDLNNATLDCPSLGVVTCLGNLITEPSPMTNDVWFRYSPTGDGIITVEACGVDTTMMVYVGGGCPATDARRIGCVDDSLGDCGTGSRITFNAFGSQQFLIRLGGKNGSEPSGTLTIARQPDCNGNGRPDSVDILCGFGNTCDGIPGSGDCNGNGNPDDCDIACGAGNVCGGFLGADDCDNNGVPDGIPCQFPAPTCGCLDGTVTWLDPLDNTHFAEQPNEPTDATLQAQQVFTVLAPDAADADSGACWQVCSTIDTGNAIDTVVSLGGGAYEITLLQPLAPGAITKITYDNSALGGSTVQTGTFTYHPADVNMDGVSDAADILALIDALTGVSPLADSKTDMDRSGGQGASDVPRLLDLLFGAHLYTPGWFGVTTDTVGCP